MRGNANWMTAMGYPTNSRASVLVLGRLRAETLPSIARPSRERVGWDGKQ